MALFSMVKGTGWHNVVAVLAARISQVKGTGRVDGPAKTQLGPDSSQKEAYPMRARSPTSHSNWWHDDVIKWKHFPRSWPSVTPVTGGFPSQKPVTRSFEVSFDLRLNKRLSKQSRSQWFETPSRPLWRNSNGCESPKWRQQSYDLMGDTILYFGKIPTKWEESIILLTKTTGQAFRPWARKLTRYLKFAGPGHESVREGGRVLAAK